ncbi:MAG: hypothetical protein AAFV93_07675, partial [Chloroflexota bacterium]
MKRHDNPIIEVYADYAIDDLLYRICPFTTCIGCYLHETFLSFDVSVSTHFTCVKFLPFASTNWNT